MTSDETLEYLYGLQMFGIKLGLDNIHCLLNSVDNPQSRYGIVHVAGTNGKGSVCSFLREILTEAGYRVGTYTSPHLHRFNERITINNQPIADADVVSLVQLLRDKNPHHCATFFEFTTALALLYFAQARVDIVILEVGMGGRLDATNIVTPLVSVITAISHDHQQHLGSDLAAIAAEKAGIIKAQVPVVIAEQPPDVMAALLAQAARLAAPAWIAGRDFRCRQMDNGLCFESPQHQWSGLTSGLAGHHQHQNLAAALMALGCLQAAGFTVTPVQLQRGVKNTRWPGRLEWWPGTEPALLLDGAHNLAGAQALAEFLRSQQILGVHWLAGFKADKDVAAIIAALAPAVVKIYAVPVAIEAFFSPARVVQYAHRQGVAAQSFSTVAEALNAARCGCQSGEIVVVAGSLFLVAECRQFLISGR